MKCIALLMISLMLLSICVMGLPDQSYTKAPNSAPTPAPPVSHESLGIQTPSLIESFPTPGQQEVSRGLIRTFEKFAYTVPRSQKLTAADTTVTKPIVPLDDTVPSILYVSYAPQTVAGCYLYDNLPLWLQTSSSGYVWFYEWYPGGLLDISYVDYVTSPGWYKKWIFLDVPGWHILQYYCNGWSNYVYIYVSGQRQSTLANSASHNSPAHYQCSSFQPGRSSTPSSWPSQLRLSGSLPISIVTNGRSKAKENAGIITSSIGAKFNSARNTISK